TTNANHREFTSADAYIYDLRSPWRWVSSHVWRYPLLPLIYLVTLIGMASTQSLGAVFVGRSFDTVSQNPTLSALGWAALWVLSTYVGYGLFDIVNSQAIRILAQRVERDARDEVYLSLLGKSQTFHGRQRVGELMARVTNDVQMINQLISPAMGMSIESIMTLIVPLVTIASMRLELLIVPIVFLVCFSVTLEQYNRALRPVASGMRERFGVMNARLAESISGIEVVKGYAQEPAEEKRFLDTA